MLISKSTFGAYYLFAFCSLLTTIVVAIFMVETRGHSLEAIEQRYLDGQATGKTEEKKEGIREEVRAVV